MPSQGRIPRPPVILIAICAVVDLLVLIPIGITLFDALRGDVVHATHLLVSTTSWSLIGNTIGVAVIATPLCGVLGTIEAWLIERTTVPWKSVWSVLLVAPLTMPLFVTSYTWAHLGPLFQGEFGAIGIIVVSYTPLVFLLVSAALRGLDPVLEEVAQSMGSSPIRTFFTVVLPQLWPALVGSMLLVGLDALVEFDAFVALSFQTISTSIYAQYQTSFSSSGAAVLSVSSIICCIVLLIVERLIRGNRNYTRLAHGAQRPMLLQPNKKSLPFRIGLLLLFAGIGIILPLVTLIYWFSSGSSLALNLASLSLQTLPASTLTSLMLGLVTAVFTVVLAFPIALLITRYPTFLANMMERTVFLAFALPDLVGAIAISSGASAVTPWLYETVPLLIYAYLILYLPLAVVALRTSLGQIEPRFEDVARTLGSSPLGVIRRVTLPLARPGIGAAAVLVFAFVLGDLSTTQVLSPPGMTTLGTQFWADSSTVAFAAAAPYALVLALLAGIAAIFLMRWFGKRR